MNDYLSQTLNIFRSEVVYSPLAEDVDVFDCSPRKFSTSSNLNLKFLKCGRKLFQNNNQTFKINRKNSDSKNKRGRIRTFFNEFQNKVHTWSKEIKSNFQRDQGDVKTPNCVTPNRRIRRMLGRTPEKLYSPFSIETPRNFQWHTFHERTEDRFEAIHSWLTPPKLNNKKKLRRSPLLFH